VAWAYRNHCIYLECDKKPPLCILSFTI